jgi:haloacetate dehalogenase
MKLGDDFIHFSIPVTHDISIRGSQAGVGPPLLLLHGFPQTSLMWHKVAPQLTSSYRVIAVDLPGYGASSKPADNGLHKAYSKSTMAKHIATVMERLNYTKYFVCGHDRGGRVAHKLCVDYPEHVSRVMLLDIVPTLAMYKAMDQEAGTAYWHWFFLIQPPPFPERLILGNPELFASKFMTNTVVGSQVFHPDALKEYTDQLREREGVHGVCEDYRAGATVDLEEQREDIEKGRKIQCATKVLWGKKGLVGKKFDALQEWRPVATDVEGEEMDCGHYIAEEQPEELLRHMRGWFVVE